MSDEKVVEEAPVQQLAQLASQSQLTPQDVLPPGISFPPGTDVMAACQALAESGEEFAKQFDRSLPEFHGGLTTPVPMGGQRVPESMGGAAAANWQDLPETQPSIEQSYGPEYDEAKAAYETLNKCKKAISVLNKPVEMAMKVRLQYKGAEGDDHAAMQSRLKGAENTRDGALDAAIEIIRDMKSEFISDRTRNCVKETKERGQFEFEDKETFGEYMQVLQQANQAIFADQKKLLQKIKDIKKAAQTTQGTAASPATSTVIEGAATAAAAATTPASAKEE